MVLGEGGGSDRWFGASDEILLDGYEDPCVSCKLLLWCLGIGGWCVVRGVEVGVSWEKVLCVLFSVEKVIVEVGFLQGDNIWLVGVDTVNQCWAGDVAWP
jgi:hypothetical protein